MTTARPLDRALPLTALLRCSVVAADGRRLGRATDLTVDIGHNPPPVVRVRVGRGRHARLVPFAGLVVASGATDVCSVLAGSRSTRGRHALAEHELSLVSDVLDVQVIDVDGHRVARVSDVVLQDHGPVLEVVGVDVGVGSLARRLGLRRPSHGPVTVVPVDRLHLTSPRGHRLQLSTPWAAVHGTDPQQLAHLLGRLAPGKTTDVVRIVGPRRVAAALLGVPPPDATAVLRGLPAELLERVRRHLPPGSVRTHPHLHRDPGTGRRTRRLDGWRRGRPDGDTEEATDRPTGSPPDSSPDQP